MVIVLVSENTFDFVAHVVGDGIVLGGKLVNGRFWMSDGLSILDKESFDLLKVTVISSVSGDELSNNSDWFGGINLEV